MKKKYRFYWEDNEKEINIELPGFTKDEIQVTVADGFATISAAKKEHNIRKGKNFYSEEASMQSISRSFSLPEEMRDDTDVAVKDGVVSIKKKKRKVVE